MPVLPVPPLFSRQTRDDTPSEPAASTTSLCEAFVSWPSFAMYAAGQLEFGLRQLRVAHEACRWCTAADMISRKRGFGAPRNFALHRCRDLARVAV